jgi:hypothetical protein
VVTNSCVLLLTHEAAGAPKRPAFPTPFGAEGSYNSGAISAAGMRRCALLRHCEERTRRSIQNRSTPSFRGASETSEPGIYFSRHSSGAMDSGPAPCNASRNDEKSWFASLALAMTASMLTALAGHKATDGVTMNLYVD